MVDKVKEPHMSEVQPVEVKPVVHYHVPGPEGGREMYDMLPYVEMKRGGYRLPSAYHSDARTKMKLVGDITITLDEVLFDLRWVPAGGTYVHGLSVLSIVLYGGKKLFFVVRDNYINGSADASERLENRRRWYETHTCPTNWLSQVKELILDGRPDPHGVFSLECVFTADEVLEKTGVKLDDYLEASNNINPPVGKFFNDLIPDLMSE